MNFENEELSALVKKRALLYLGGGVHSISVYDLKRITNGVLYILASPIDQNVPCSNLQERFDFCLNKTTEEFLETKALWGKIMEHFQHYSLSCLKETMTVGMESFFKVYNTDFFPNENILTLDYPVLKMKNNLCGARRIKNYLEMVETEQKLLSYFCEDEVKEALAFCCPDNEYIVNILSSVFVTMFMKSLRLPLREIDKEKTVLYLNVLIARELTKRGIKSEDYAFYVSHIAKNFAARVCIK